MFIQLLAFLDSRNEIEQARDAIIFEMEPTESISP